MIGTASPPRLALFSRLRIRLLVLVLMAILPALLLVIAIALAQRRTAVKTTQTGALRVVRDAADRQRQHIQAARQLLLTLVRDREVQQKNTETCNALFRSLLPLHDKIYSNILATDHEGRVFAAGLASLKDESLGDRLFFKRVQETRRFSASHYELDREEAKAMLMVAAPVLEGEGGKLQAVVVAALDLNWLNQFAALSDLPDSSTLTVIDARGRILLRYPDVEKRWTQQALDELPAFKTLLERRREGLDRFRDADGVEHFLALTPLSRTAGIGDAWVIASIPAHSVFAPAHRLLMQNLLYLGVVSILALAAAWFGGEYFLLRNVHKLVASAQRLAQGELHARTGIKKDRSELGQLARTFDEMAAALEQRQAELEKLNEELEGRVATRTLELKRSNEELEQFAYVASHDLQEPLRMVTNYMQLLKQRYGDSLDTNAQDFIGFALDGAFRMQRLIHDLLTYSRIGTQGKPLDPVACEEVLERTLSNLKVTIDETNATVTHDPLPTVRGDASQLMQLLQNLIGNAIKFRGERPAVVHVAAHRKGPYWQFAVRDRGIGVLPKDFARIFVIFQRLHGRDKYPGTGIGLSICKKIVERHGGRIWVESHGGHGTTFCFTLQAVD